MCFLEIKSERLSGSCLTLDFFLLLTHSLEGLAVLLLPHPPAQPSPLHTSSPKAVNPLQPLCLHSTFCRGTFSCCWNTNSNTALITSPARRWTAPATGLCLNQEAPQGPLAQCSPIFMSIGQLLRGQLCSFLSTLDNYRSHRQSGLGVEILERF